ncbi:Methyltranfer-dom domain-containing protein [Favolaschia claudopus]|uniref:Methyltranfer-dom domain-containing protein n=1 Tax=Favolaschia claudopus TaxID=2862362 RepID=A0AAW0D975_9AGAR
MNLDAARQLITSPLVDSLLFTHPNDLSSTVSPPDIPFREPWWAWTRDTDSCRWIQLLEYYNDPSQRSDWDIPLELRELIDQLTKLALPRDPIHVVTDPPLELSSRGMSPKKAHEVFQSVAYISNLLNSAGIDPRRTRIVDIGAGQAYLTRGLQIHLGTTHLLALDSSDVQTQGAQRRQDQSGTSITQKTIHITPTTLCESIDEWIQAEEAGRQEAEGEPAPVVLVALHACGSLTPDILRAFFVQRNTNASMKDRRLWAPVAVIAVGCCYNLLAPQDFPLSKRLTEASPPIRLPTSAYHMAAQIPAQWFRSQEAREDATLALRKVVWRAIIGARFTKRLRETNQEERGEQGQAREQEQDGVKADGTGDRPVMRRLGRLNNNVYEDWKTFARVAEERIGPLGEGGSTSSDTSDTELELDAEERKLISELEVLHVLRCIIGPVVESLIIMDRQQWVQEQLDEEKARRDGEMDMAHGSMQVELVNLFDQATGSGRNIALVLRPPSSTE